MEQLDGATNLFARLSEGSTAALRCTVIPDEDPPILSVSSQSLRKLGEIGADLELDIISVDGPERELAAIGQRPSLIRERSPARTSAGLISSCCGVFSACFALGRSGGWRGAARVAAS